MVPHWSIFRYVYILFKHLSRFTIFIEVLPKLCAFFLRVTGYLQVIYLALFSVILNRAFDSLHTLGASGFHPGQSFVYASYS